MNNLRYVIGNILKNNIALFTALILAMLTEALMAISSVVTIVPFVDIILNSQSDSSNQVTKFFNNILNYFGLSGNYLTFGLLFFFTNLLKALISIKVLEIILKIKFQIIKSFRMSLLDASFSSQWKFFNGLGKGKLMNSLNEELNKISDLFSELATAASYSIQILAYLVLPFIFDYKITILVLITTLGLLLPFIFLNRILLRLGKKNTEAGNFVIGLINESIQAAKIIISYGNKKKNLDKIKEATEEFNTTAIKQRILQSLSSNAFKPTAILILILIFGYVGDIQSNLTYLAAIFWSLYSALPLLAILLRSNLKLATYFPSFEQYNDLKNKAIKFQFNSGIKKIENIENKIYLKNLSFHYDNKINILENLNLEIKKNKITSIVGKSGSGKSTISDLLLGLQSPHEGEIFFDNDKINNIDIEFLRKKISFVPQDPILFYDTIRNNLIWAQSNPSEDDIIKSLKLANAYDFIMALPKKLDSVVGERGSELSGGERQRIVLARAFLRKPFLLILDEATSGLDKISENIIRDTLKELSKNTTILVIAHKSKIIEASDYIYVINNKRIIEEGNFENLNNKDKSFFKTLNY